MKYLVIASLGMLSFGSLNAINKAPNTQQLTQVKDKATYKAIISAFENKNYEEVQNKFKELSSAKLKKEVLKELHKACFSPFEKASGSVEETLKQVYEQINALYSQSYGNRAYIEIANYLSEEPNRLEKYRVFFDQALEGYLSNIESEEGSDEWISEYFEYLKPLYKADLEKAEELTEFIYSNYTRLAPVEPAPTSEAEKYIHKQTFVLVDKMLAQFAVINENPADLKAAKKHSKGVKFLIYRLTDAKARADYLIRYLDLSLSLFGDPEDADPIISAINETIALIEDDQDRKNLLDSLSALQDKYSLFLLGK